MCVLRSQTICFKPSSLKQVKHNLFDTTNLVSETPLTIPSKKNNRTLCEHSFYENERGKTSEHA